MITLRVQTRDGLKQTKISPSSTVAQLKTQLLGELKIDVSSPSFKMELSTRALPGQPAQKFNSDKALLAQYNLKNGDIIVMQTPQTEEAKADGPKDLNSENSVVTSIGKKGEIVTTEEKPVSEVVEDEVDQILAKTDGWIDRRDPKSRTAKPDDYIAPWCIMAHSPWKEQKIKHLPFHSWIKEQVYRSGSNTKPSLVEDTFVIEKGDRLTSKQLAQTTVTVTRQSYRHVDDVLFQHRSIVDGFIEGWRSSGLQRCGFLVGRYVPNESIPLGITAEVVGIYEPPQQSTRDAVLLLKDDKSDEIDAFLARMGLRRVGFIWSNLIVNEKRELINDREPDAPLLPLELIRMAHLQRRYPSPWATSRSGKFGSKFVSVIVRGTDDNNVELDAYMLSNQGVALITEGVIKGNSKDKKNLRVVRSKPDSKEIFPDLLYSDKDEYNNTIIKKADPSFPSAYFLIGLRHGFPTTPNPLFKQFTFPIENRPDKLPSWTDARLHLLEPKPPRPLSQSLLDFHFALFAGVFDVSSAVSDLVVNLVRNEAIKDDRLKQIVQAEVDKKAPKPVAPAPSASKPSASQPAKNDPHAALKRELLGMGFSENQITEALFVTNGVGGAEAALNYILNNS